MFDSVWMLGLKSLHTTMISTAIHFIYFYAVSFCYFGYKKIVSLYTSHSLSCKCLRTLAIIPTNDYLLPLQPSQNLQA